MSFYRFQAAGKPPGFSRRRGSGRSNISGNHQHGFENQTWNAASNYLDQQGRPKARKGKYQSHWESFRQPVFCTCSSIYVCASPFSGPLPFYPISQDTPTSAFCNAPGCLADLGNPIVMIPSPDGQWVLPMDGVLDVSGPPFTATMDSGNEFLPLNHHTQQVQHAVGCHTTEMLEDQERTQLNNSQSSQDENREYLPGVSEEPGEPIEDSTPAQSPESRTIII